MQRIIFNRGNKQYKLDLEEINVHTALEVLKIFGYGVKNTEERQYSNTERIYIMSEADDVKELRHVR